MKVNNFMLVSGKMGNYVFCTYRGQQYVRRRPRKREGAPSPKQEAQMERMAAVAIFYRALKEAGLFPYWETAAEGLYPIVRPLYYYYDSRKEPFVGSFITYILSPKGQASVLEQGFIPVGKEKPAGGNNVATKENGLNSEVDGEEVVRP